MKTCGGSYVVGSKMCMGCEDCDYVAAAAKKRRENKCTTTKTLKTMRASEAIYCCPACSSSCSES